MIKHKSEGTKGEKTPNKISWSCRVDDVRIIKAKDDYILAELSDDLAENLEACPCEVSVVDNVVLIARDQYTKCAAPNDNGEIAECDWIADATGVAKLLIRYADYDYTYKGKRGHTKTIRLAGISWREVETDRWYE